MSQELLHDLQGAVAPAAGHLEAAERLVGATKHELRLAGDGMKGLCRTFESAWESIVGAVARGRTAEMQAERPNLIASFDDHLKLLKRSHALMASYRTFGNDDGLDPESLQREIAGMERLRARVFDLWRTADDLEDLAARDYPLTTADLDRIGSHLSEGCGGLLRP